MASHKRTGKKSKSKRLSSQKTDKKTRRGRGSSNSLKKNEKKTPVGRNVTGVTRQLHQDIDNKYYELIEKSLQGIVVIQDFRILFANSATAEISGYTVQELLSFSPEQLKSMINPEDQALVWGRFRDRLAGKTIPSTYEYRIKRKDGSEAWLETFSRRIKYQGKPAIQATLIDITRRKQAEKALEETNKLLETLLDHTHMMVAYLDPQFNFVRVNRAYARADEREPSFFPGKNHFHLYPNPENEKIFKTVVKTGKPYFAYARPFEYAEHPERGVTYWDWSLIPIKDQAEEVTSLVLTVVNVTERKQKEEALRNTLEDSQKREKEISALLQGSRVVLESREFQETARAIFDSCKSLIGATAGYVALLSKDGKENELLFLDAGGLPCTVDNSLPMPIRGLREQAYKTGKVAYDNSFSKSKWTKYLPAGHATLQNVLFAPLIVKGQAAGLLGLANKPGGFTENDARLASAFSELCAIALMNSQMLESLEKSEERFRSVAQTASDAIVTIDTSGKIVFWNRVAEAMFGYSVDQALGKSLTLIMPKRFHEAHKKGVNRVLSKGETKIIGKTVEMEGIKKNGKEFPLELSVATWKSGEEIFFTGIIRDTTERKRAEYALRESEEKFRNLAEQSPNMIFINKRGRVVYANQKCEEIMGYKREEFYSPDFNFFDLIAPESRDLIKASFSRHLKGEEVAPYEYTLITKGGSKIDSILTPKLIKYEGEEAILGTVTDITERKRAEQEIQELNQILEFRAQELAAANKELEAFSYSVSHDLRAPLRTIDGFSRALLEDYGKNLDETGKDYLRRVHAGTQHMRQLIDDLLNLSLVIRTKITPEETNLSKLAHNIAADLKKIQPDRQVQFVIQEGVLVQGDSRLLREVLENLFSNAWKFTEKNSHAKIEFGKIRNKEQIVYFVRDNGVGFDMIYSDKLFTPFQRLHSTTEFSGNGIGLAIAKRIINRHGGYIWAEAEVEKGATFYFTLP